MRARLLLLVLLALWPHGSQAADRRPTGTVAGVVVVRVGKQPPKPQAGVLVYVKGVPAQASKARAAARISQKDLQFHPDWTVVVKGDTVAFPNNDNVDHNVFSRRADGTVLFNLKRYGRGATRDHTFRRAGDYEIYCNIHKEMSATVKVLDDAHFAITGADGSFTLPDVPEGSYEVVAWRRHNLERVATVTVVAGQRSAAVALELVQGPKPSNVKRSDGTPYPSY